MALESATYISQLVSTNPLGSDSRSSSDDHHRLVKSVLLNTLGQLSGAVTATHTELNILDGCTSTTAELNLLDGVTATTNELNYVDVAAAGTAEASKAVVLDASKDITGINVLNTTTLQVGGVAVTATPAEINAICDGRSLASSDDKIDNFPAGTLMTFQQTAAPTGWTKQTTHNNKGLRVVNGTASSGGTDTFTTCFNSSKATDAHTLTLAQIPAHDHGGGDHTHAGGLVPGSGGSASSYDGGTQLTSYSDVSASGAVITSQGGGNSHTHNLTIDLQYVDIIIASKN